MRPFTLLSCLAALAIGCQQEVLLPPDPDSDTDGDGVNYAEELDGYLILVNTTGVPGARTERRVNSDPARPDTDEDGLTDLQERTLRTDPNRADTDGDGLSDHEEIERWFTDPASVDSDGDATGGDVGNTAPLTALFDGAELQLVDGNAGPEATSPLSPDTDGDGASDHREFLSESRSAVLADRPTLGVELATGTGIEMVVDLLSGESLTESHRYETSTGSSDITRFQLNTGAAFSYNGYAELGVYASLEASAGASISDLGGTVEGTGWGEVEIGGGAEVSGSMNTSLTNRQDRSQTWEDAFNEVSVANWSYDSATVAMTLEVTNTSNRAFTFDRLGIAVASVAAGGGTDLRPLTTLYAPEGSPSTLAPGQSTQVLVRDDDVRPERVVELIQSGSIHLLPSQYDLLDADDQDFDFTVESILERTTLVEIDDGAGSIQRFHRATGIDRAPDGTRVPTRLGDLLDQLGVDAASRTVDGRIVYDIDGLPTIAHDGPSADLTGLDPGGYPLTGGIGQVNYEQAWFVFYEPAQPTDGPTPPDLLDIPVRPGDRVSILRTKDADLDGLLAFEEGLNGTDDNAVDTDGDGLSDFWELNEGWVVTTDQISFEVTSAPAEIDTDGDGLSDLEEFQLGTSPQHRDTDGDGYTDAFEVEWDEQPPLDALVFDTSPSIPVVTCTVDPVCGGIELEVSDDLGDVVRIDLLYSVVYDYDDVVIGGAPTCEETAGQFTASGVHSASFDPPLGETWSSAEDGYALSCNFSSSSGVCLDHLGSALWNHGSGDWDWVHIGPSCAFEGLSDGAAQPGCTQRPGMYNITNVTATLTIQVEDAAGHLVDEVCTVESF